MEFKEIPPAKPYSPRDARAKLVSEKPQVRNALSLGARKATEQYFSEEVSLRQLKELMQKIRGDLD